MVAAQWPGANSCARVLTQSYRASSDLGRSECVSADVEAVADKIRVRVKALIQNCAWALKLGVPVCVLAAHDRKQNFRFENFHRR